MTVHTVSNTNYKKGVRWLAELYKNRQVDAVTAQTLNKLVDLEISRLRMQLGDMETAIVKQASGRFAAECLAPQITQEMIYLAATRAVQRLEDGDVPDPFVLDTPIRVTVEFFSSDMADRASKIPFTQREGTRVSLTVQEMASAYSGFRSMVMLAVG